jgi:hypothetical protein
MSLGRPRLPSLTAALAGIPAGIQAAGPWAGRRQLFVKFAQEAETATMFTADALRSELERIGARSSYHSVALAGRDPLDEIEFLLAAFRKSVFLPLMLDHDGQRPAELERLVGTGALSLVQVTLDGCEGEAALERAVASLSVAAGKRVAHAMVLIPHESASDAQLLRIVERGHDASVEVAVVVHPLAESPSDDDLRWPRWMERATSVHRDVRMLPKLPPLTGMR